MRYVIMFVYYDGKLDMYVRSCIAQCEELEDARVTAHACLDRRRTAYSFCEIYDVLKDATFMVLKEE